MKKDNIQSFAFQFIKLIIDKYKKKNKILEFCRIHRECNDYIEYLNYELYISMNMNEKYEEILND